MPEGRRDDYGRSRSDDSPRINAAPESRDSRRERGGEGGRERARPKGSSRCADRNATGLYSAKMPPLNIAKRAVAPLYNRRDLHVLGQPYQTKSCSLEPRRVNDRTHTQLATFLRSREDDASCPFARAPSPIARSSVHLCTIIHHHAWRLLACPLTLPSSPPDQNGSSMNENRRLTLHIAVSRAVGPRATA